VVAGSAEGGPSGSRGVVTATRRAATLNAAIASAAWRGDSRGLIQPVACFGIVIANAKQYFVNKLSRMHISIVQGIKLLSKIIGDVGILGRQIKIKARHQRSQAHAKICVCLEQTL
jgi:cobalamin biosynthesis protein CobD/CbiB